MTAAQDHAPNKGTLSAEAFLSAVSARRDKVYDYLDAWPGSSEFKPRDIHDALFSYVRRRGKALRPIVLLLSCAALGGNEDQALPAAAAVEIFHTWTLVHDDIIDRDATRRGLPTVHAMYTRHAIEQHALLGEDAAHYGNAVAILAGDLQQSWAFSLLCDLQNRGVDAGLVLELVSRMSGWLTPALLEGEMLDVQYSLAPPLGLSEADVLSMLTLKTAALLEYAAWAGARIGIAGRPDDVAIANDIGKFAGLCGIAFQLQDDLLGLTADPLLLGKPVGSDLREGKRTLVVYRALSLANAKQRSLLLDVLGNKDATESATAAGLAVLHDTGAISQVRQLADEYISHAHAILSGLPPSSERMLLAAWADFLLARTH